LWKDGSRIAQNKTLETLLTMPIKKSYIITGKIVASAIVSLVMALVYMVGFSYYLRAFSEGIRWRRINRFEDILIVFIKF
jgi:ABC-type Na+ efflux pump permease subunit